MVTRLRRPRARVDAFDALADPTRRAIVERLCSGEELSAGALAGAFPRMSRPAVSKHLGVLRAAGVVRARTDGRRRLYALDARGVAEIDAWLERYRATWQRRFVVLRGAA
jgi:DNA-binding transcriptional ArsR family regulator